MDTVILLLDHITSILMIHSLLDLVPERWKSMVLKKENVYM